MTKDDRITDFGKLWSDFASEESLSLILKNDFMGYLNESFFTAPASTKYHGAYEGGLYDHSRQVYIRLKNLTENNGLKWERPESPFIIGMFHDLCKCDQYKKIGGTVLTLNGIEVSDPTGYHYEYNTDTVLKGHGSKSVMILSQFITLTEEEMLCIRYHMGPYEKEEWQEFDAAIRRYQNVYWTHAADMLASKVDDV